MKNPIFDAYGKYYDLLYSDKNYQEESFYIASLLAKHDINSGRLLEFGSGTGKHGRLLAKKGYTVHGIEKSQQMVDKAEQINGFTCQVGDICNINLHSTFDAILSLFHVVSYQTTNEKLNSLFSTAASHLKIGGIFIFDFWYSPAVYTIRPSVRVKNVSDEEIKITRISEPTILSDENRVDIKFTIFAEELNTKNISVITENHPMRHFSLPEIDFLSSIYGFKRIQSEEFLTSKPVSLDTWGVCVVLQKI